MSHHALQVPIWQLFKKLDTAIDQQLPLPARLQNVNQALLDALGFDAAWCVTLPPLDRLGCGLVRTPLSLDKQAGVQVTDQQPVADAAQFPPTTVLSQLFSQQTLQVISAEQPADQQLDGDLGDVLFDSYGVTIVAALPLLASDTVWGGLVLGCRGQPLPEITPETRHLLEYLSNYLGRALQQLHMATNAGRYADTMQAINRIGRTITSRLNLDEVITQTMVGINTMLDVEAGSLLLLDKSTRELYFKITLRGEHKQISAYRLTLDEGIAGWTVANNQAVISNSPRSDPRFTSKIDQAIGFKTNSVLCVPLLVQGRPIGALEVLNKRQGDFVPADQELLEAMSASVGVALNNALLYNRVQERAHLGEVINRITAEINAGHGFSATAQAVYSHLSRMSQCDHISFSMVDKVSGMVRQWLFSPSGADEQNQHTIPFVRSRLESLIDQQQAFVVDNISTRPTLPEDRILVNDNVKSVVGVLLKTGDSPYGCLQLGSRQPGFFGLEQLQLLQQLSPHLGVVLEKALQLDEMRQRTHGLHQLNRLIEMLVSITDIEAIAETVIKTLPRLLPGDAYGVLLSSESGIHLRLATPTHFKHEQQIKQYLLDTLNEFRVAELPVVVSSDKTITTDASASEDLQLLSPVSLPIITRRGAVGIIYCATNQHERMGQEFLYLFSLLASQISAAVENAWLFTQIERESAQLTAILTSSTDAVLVVDRDWRIVLDNPAALDVLEEVVSQRGRLLGQVTQSGPLLKLFNSAMNGDTNTGEIPLPDGRTFFANLSPVVIAQGDAIGWVATMHDVSHFKELNELKNEFINIVSHDLRSPLSAIVMAVGLIADLGPVNAEQQQLLDMVDRRTHSMSELIDDLLDVGKIEAGIDFNLYPTNLVPLVEETVNAAMPLAQDKQITLEMMLTPNLGPVLANASRLRQAVYNLVGNSIKYTPPQGQVLVKLFAHDQEIRFQAIDSGIGIPAADQPHIFEKFYRVGGEHAMAVKGTGLGLAIVKSVVEKHHGRIWLESVFGEGSTFTIALPLAPDGQTDAK